MTRPDLSRPYEPREVEERWYAFWERNRVFEASDEPGDTRPVYVIPMPPPNVTGSLHMGHAQRCTLEDALIRWYRMRGYNALWQPGIDHAGIATQTVVERQLQQEGTTRHELGRTAFEERVWQWKNESGGRISVQQRVLGASPDWRRMKFTMDPDMSAAVREAFVLLYEDGLMYRATRLINWCTTCRTALSDLEVENEEGSNGELFEFAYKVDGEDREIVVATTRPETMLGDVAVAVHPGDARYASLHGRFVVHPFVDRKIPIITDAVLVDPKFGTGAVKVTPAHDFGDFATGKRHGLAEINILALDGTLNENAGPFQGMDRKKARAAVKKALEEQGLGRGAKAHQLTLPRCQRSGDVVEPIISTQWFCKMSGMAKEAIDAVKTGRTRIVPEEWEKTYHHFLENIQDWCVSRQLWWGHQIPAWHGPNGEIRVARERPAECTLENGWTRDPDVLDTWFSSALWPFSTLGWPDDTPTLRRFYPTNAAQESDLETGYDILFFWVARMMMFGLYFMKEVPFRRVLLSGLLVDETGEKMSKVKGNVIDPLDLIHGAEFIDIVKKALPGAPEAEALAKFRRAYPSTAAMGGRFPAFGTDALRFTLATFPPSNKRVALAPKRFEGYRHFINKIWNATRFALDQLEGFSWTELPKPQALYNRWVVSRLAAAARITNGGMGAFRMDEAANEVYRFFWSDFCDWYLELTKTVLAESSPFARHTHETRAVLAYVLEGSLRLMHPLMPFVTEELWQRVPKPASRRASIAFGPYPGASEESHADPAAEREMDIVMATISAARTIRSEHGIKWPNAVPLELRADAEDIAALLRQVAFSIHSLAKTNSLPVIAKTGGPRTPGTVVSIVPTPGGPIEVLVGLRGLVTQYEELARIEREFRRIDKDIAQLEKKLASHGFAHRAPQEVVDEANAQRTQLVAARTRLEASRRLADEL